MSNQQIKQALEQFSQAVGTDIKQLTNEKADKTELAQKFDELQSVIAGKSSDTQAKINEAITALKNELLGGDVDETLDTLKEIGEKLKELGESGTVAGAITEKLTELKSQIDEVANADLVAIYNQAKGA